MKKENIKKRIGGNNKNDKLKDQTYDICYDCYFEKKNEYEVNNGKRLFNGIVIGDLKDYLTGDGTMSVKRVKEQQNCISNSDEDFDDQDYNDTPTKKKKQRNNKKTKKS
jgi:hypothetical protein